jgi:membrane protease YdiL (CAAX protease family)
MMPEARDAGEWSRVRRIRMEEARQRLDWRAAVAVITSTLLLVVGRYHIYLLPRDWPLTELLLNLVVPLLLIVAVFRESPARYGVRTGDWRRGLILTGVACAAVAILMIVVARTSDFRTYYGPASRTHVQIVIRLALSIFIWEFFFRGFLLFALYRACGPLALILQAVPFTMGHLGKPELETLGCIFGGTILGYVAWRTRSILYPFLIHWFLAWITIRIAAGPRG